MSIIQTRPDLGLDDRLQAIVDADYPRFSEAEMKRRRDLMAAAMDQAGVDHLVAYASFFRGGPVHWLCDWLTTFEAVLVFTPGRADTVFVQFYNHLPQAQSLLSDLDIRWGGQNTMASVAAELKGRGATAGKVGAIGLLPMHCYTALDAEFAPMHDLNRAYFGVRMVKSAEELDWYRVSARMSDVSIDLLRQQIRPGLQERDLGAITESAYLGWRGQNIIHFFNSTPMRSPESFVPRQHLMNRTIETGDVIVTEITASYFEYWGQVLRTFSVGEPLIPEYQTLHETAEAAYDAMLSAIRPGAHVRDLGVGRQLIEDAGFTFFDDLVHGFGGGYLPPVLGSPTRGEEELPDIELREGMMMVLQPNVITPDRRAGVQFGDCVVVTADAAESIHTAPRGPFVVG